jgi:hypothetical protein
MFLQHILLASVMLTIMSPLSLSADQVNNVMAKASLEFGAITLFHLDGLKDPAMQQDLLEKLLLLPRDTAKTILLSMLPQALHNHSCSSSL